MLAISAKFTLLLAAAQAAYAFQYTVGVGKDETTGKVGIGFDPSSIRPAVGDTIVFHFNAGTHQAIQSTFENPCTPKEGGYNSGPQTVADGTPVDTDSTPKTTFTVETADPIYFYDGGVNQCHLGAVFTSNPPLAAPGTAGEFLDKAKATPEQDGSTPPPSGPPANSTTNPPPTNSSTGTGPTNTEPVNEEPNGASTLGAPFVAGVGAFVAAAFAGNLL